MSDTKYFYAICEVEYIFDKAMDQSMCRVLRVLQVCRSEEEAEEFNSIFNPMRYGDFDTNIRVVRSDRLEDTFR